MSMTLAEFLSHAHIIRNALVNHEQTARDQAALPRLFPSEKARGEALLEYAEKVREAKEALAQLVRQGAP